MFKSSSSAFLSVFPCRIDHRIYVSLVGLSPAGTSREKNHLFLNLSCFPFWGKQIIICFEKFLYPFLFFLCFQLPELLLICAICVILKMAMCACVLLNRWGKFWKRVIIEQHVRVKELREKLF